MMLVKLHEMMKRRSVKSQGELAQMTGLSGNTISAISQGRGRSDTIGKICLALDRQPSDFLEYVPDRPKRKAKR